MSSILYSQYGVNEVQFVIDFLKENIGAYQLSKLTGGNCGDVPGIHGVHPLSMELGNMVGSSDPTNYTSVLPAIGVELITDDEYSKQFLGSGYKVMEITDEYLAEVTAIPLAERYNKGILLSDENLEAIKDMKEVKEDEKLYAILTKFLQDQTVVISLWSTNPDVTRIVYLVLRSLLKKMKRLISAKGVKNLSISGNSAFYNYDFGQVLFGAEFTLKMMNWVDNIEVFDDIVTLKTVEELYSVNDFHKTHPDKETGNTFKPIGG